MVTETPAGTAVAIAAAVRAGERTARAVVDAALERIAAVDGRINAYQVVRADAARREADDVDARPDRADLPLAGVPVAIKDNVSVKGEPLRAGSAGTADTASEQDHEVVRRLRAAGAVVVGLTRVPELCVFGATDSIFGITRNPWDLERSAGGSSGGSGAAVAAGTVPVAHGNDGMGSIRIPAACCGLVGLKPGTGVVPADLGNGSWFDMAENGPLATTVADAALVLSVLAGRPELADVTDPPPLRVAVSTRAPLPATPVNRHWAGAARAAGDQLRAAGHSVTVAHPPYGQSLGTSGLARWTAGTELDARLLPHRDRLEPRVRRHAAVGRAVLRLGYPKQKGRTRWQQRAGRFFERFDVLVTPALAQPPLPARNWGERGWLVNVLANTRFAPFAAPWNLAGWPAMTVPAGLDPDGRPVAVQLVAPPGGEARLLAVAAQLERANPWPRTAPL